MTCAEVAGAPPASSVRYVYSSKLPIGAGGALTAHLHALDVDLHAVEGHARVLLQHEGDLVDQVLRHRVDVGAVLDDHVQLDMHAHLGGGHHHAAAQARSRQDLGDAVGRRRGRHPHDAVALERGVAHHVGEHVVGHVQIARDLCTHDASSLTLEGPPRAAARATCGTGRDLAFTYLGSIPQAQAPAPHQHATFATWGGVGLGRERMRGRRRRLDRECGSNNRKRAVDRGSIRQRSSKLGHMLGEARKAPSPVVLERANRAVVLGFLGIEHDKGNKPASRTFAEHADAACPAVAVEERMNSIAEHVEADEIAIVVRRLPSS